MVEPNLSRYFTSLADELLAQADRVRYLIGDKHWLTDGHHKEYLLLSLLRRHLPSGVIASRGFVLNPLDTTDCSREQDILIADITKEAPLFHQGDVVVVFPSQVLAAISVKTTFALAEVKDSLDGLASVAALLPESNRPACWFGAYFFVPSQSVLENPSKAYKWIETCIGWSLFRHPVPSIRSASHFIDFVCCGGSLAFKRKSTTFEDDVATSNAVFGKLGNGLATAMFLADLFDHISTRQNNPRLIDIAALLDNYDLPEIPPGKVLINLAPVKPPPKRKRKKKT